MAEYHVVSEWKLEAPAAAVYEALRRYEHYLQWWPWVRSIRVLEEGRDDGVDTRLEYVVASPLRYTLAFEVRVTKTEPDRLLAADARGQLEGTGTWLLTFDEAVTTARYYWRVHTTRPWMNALAPLARPAFRWAHARVMDEGAAGLARHLDARLVSSANYELPLAHPGAAG